MFKHLFPVLMFPLILVGAGCTAPDVPEQMAEATEPAVLLDGSYNLVPEGSSVTWEASKVLADVKHNGTVDVNSGRLVVEEGMITEGTVTVDLQTITDLDLEPGMKEKLEGHLKSADFFDVATHPAATFTFSSQEGNLLTGIMTIKGIDREISFEVELENKEGELGLEAEMALDRTLWDVRYGSDTFFDNLGDAVIDDMFYLTLDLDFVNPDAEVVTEVEIDESGEGEDVDTMDVPSEVEVAPTQELLVE